jgi:hypothetical protein
MLGARANQFHGCNHRVPSTRMSRPTTCSITSSPQSPANPPPLVSPQSTPLLPVPTPARLTQWWPPSHPVSPRPEMARRRSQIGYSSTSSSEGRPSPPSQRSSATPVRSFTEVVKGHGRNETGPSRHTSHYPASDYTVPGGFMADARWVHQGPAQPPVTSAEDW